MEQFILENQIEERNILTRENLKVVWAEFSTLKLGRIVILCRKCMARHAATSRAENSAQASSCQLKFVHDLIQCKGHH